MDGPGGYYAKWNKSDRERPILYDSMCMWSLKNKTNEEIIQNRNTVIDTEDKLLVARGEGVGGGEK